MPETLTERAARLKDTREAKSNRVKNLTVRQAANQFLTRRIAQAMSEAGHFSACCTFGVDRMTPVKLQKWQADVSKIGNKLIEKMKARTGA